MGQELWRGVRARRAMSRDSVPAALVALVRRNRRRYGGYTVHVGIAVLFVGVAASSAFQDQRLVELRPGQTERIDGYAITYERPTSRLVAASNGRLERIDLGARLRVRRGDGPAQTLDTYKSYFPSTSPGLGPVSRFFEGEATTEVALRAGVRRDFWAAVAPDIGRLLPRIEQGDKVFADATELSEDGSRRLPGGGAARAQPLLHRLPAAGHVPPDRVAARDLDLARRADRVRGRRDRALAGRRPRAAAGDRGRAGARGARARARVAAAWSCCWCSSWWPSPCS